MSRKTPVERPRIVRFKLEELDHQDFPTLIDEGITQTEYLSVCLQRAIREGKGDRTFLVGVSDASPEEVAQFFAPSEDDPAPLASGACIFSEAGYNPSSLRTDRKPAKTVTGRITGGAPNVHELPLKPRKK